MLARLDDKSIRFIRARCLEPATKNPVDEPFTVFHSHHARVSLENQASFALDVASSKLVFGMAKRTANISMAEW